MCHFQKHLLNHCKINFMWKILKTKYHNITMITTIEEEFVGVLYNDCYGEGYKISDKALNMYNKKMKELHDDFENVSYEHEIERHDPVLVQIYDEIGKYLFSGEKSDVKKKMINKKFLDFYIIITQDGRDKVIINYDQFKFSEIKKVLETMKSDQEKVCFGL